MAQFTYTGLINRTMEIFEQHGSAEAYHFITEHQEDGAGNPAQIYNLRYSLAASSGMHEEALQLLQEAIVEQEYWYAAEYLLEEESLESLQDDAEFQRLIGICRAREAQALTESSAKLNIVLPDQEKPASDFHTIFVLHGEQENMDIVQPYWSSLLERNYKLALLQSSQVQFSGAYDWVDIDAGMDELKQSMEELARIDNPQLEIRDCLLPENALPSGKRPVLAGFSAGARVAMNTAAEYSTGVRGLILVAPWMPDREEWELGLNAWKEHGVKLYIICGERDEECLPGAQELVEALDFKGIPYVFKNVTGLGHDYPAHFNQMLQEAAAFIEG
ncbi:alpha/beta hydrolase [Paenibacillus wulumuqiensis]|uniref:alpha/beta hydrolase n=1 Tax=Paenibacillus wulumuqiensis TaxID=1567107 RepID=UPI000619ED17|nr:alpha/beta hydrolase [Paenibacillus wulumuqiensis]